MALPMSVQAEQSVLSAPLEAALHIDSLSPKASTLPGAHPCPLPVHDTSPSTATNTQASGAGDDPAASTVLPKSFTTHHLEFYQWKQKSGV
jgi:hypothetical protein